MSFRNSRFPPVSHHYAATSAAIAELADGQHRQVRRAQLRRIGVDDNALARRVRAGTLHREHRGVYSVGPPASTHHELAHGAVLACGADAYLAGWSALELWGFVRGWSAPFEVSCSHQHRLPGINTHRIRLRDRDTTDHYGIPVTTGARTVLDTARRLGPSLQDLIDRAVLTPFLTLGQLEEITELHPRHPNACLLKRFLDRDDGKIRARRERHFSGQCAAAGLPRPLIGRTVLGRERDAWFETEQLIVELDAYRTHRSEGAYESDRERDTSTLARGIATIRITVSRQFTTTDRELRRLDGILRQRRAELPVLRAAGLLGDPIRAEPLPLSRSRRRPERPAAHRGRD